jgi:tetratricopeptide (TPR) repeat protein
VKRIQSGCRKRSRATQKHDNASAWLKLEPVLKFCDKKTSSKEKTYVSVATDEEAALFKRDHPAESQVALIDIACPMAYTNAAFFMEETNDPSRAADFLQRAHTLAPYLAEPLAEPLAERAYLFRVQGDNATALATYQSALSLANHYDSSSYMRALIVRGIGFVQTELGDLTKAKEAYKQSLLIEPSNQLAKNELIYIDKISAKAP